MDKIGEEDVCVGGTKRRAYVCAVHPGGGGGGCIRATASGETSSARITLAERPRSGGVLIAKMKG